MRTVVSASLVLAAAIALASTAPGAIGQPQRQTFAGMLDEHPVIRYADHPADDAVARLASQVTRGLAALRYEEPAGYLRSTLHALDISPESQLLVFSKTGLQRAHTSPQNPRALYFNESVVIGYIPGARHLEIASHDREQGVVFYTIDQIPSAAPEITRRTSCLTCHVSGSTLEVPGMIARSNFINANGELLPQLGFHVVDHRTPITERWGGYFVTGKYDRTPYGGVTHMGNVSTSLHPLNDAPAGTSNEILHRWFDVDSARLGYASHESDIAALMVFDHQMRAINLLTRLNWEARVAASNGNSNYSRGELKQLADDVADYLLFRDEVAPPARLTPRAAFAAQFTARGPRDAQSRSFRELELHSRLLKYGVSYMIYSPAFDALPTAARQAVYRRMRAVFGGPDRHPGRWPEFDVRAVTEILLETKADWGR